jgi:hypothetical protein
VPILVNFSLAMRGQLVLMLMVLLAVTILICVYVHCICLVIVFYGTPLKKNHDLGWGLRIAFEFWFQTWF